VEFSRKILNNNPRKTKKTKKRAKHFKKKGIFFGLKLYRYLDTQKTRQNKLARFPLRI